MRHLWRALFWGAAVTRASRLLLNESFDDLSNWVEDIDGISGVISIEFDNAHGGNLVFSNVTYCPDQPEPCFRAELATPQDQRSSLFSSCSVEYWLGFSSFIPSSWSWVNSGAEQDTIYNFQLHGGDNTGNAPILGIRVQKGAMQANVCGNSAFSSSGSECLYFDLGQVVGGTWADYVIHSQLAFGEPTGFVNIWRNGQLMVSESNILTSYNDLNPPYMKVGSYIPEWGRGMPTGYRWSSVSYTSLRLGNASSSYDDVYTGMGAPCGSACDIGGDNDVKEILLDHTAIFIITVPIGIIMICSCVLYFAHRDQKCAYAEGIANMKPRKKKRNYVASNSSGHDILGTADAVTGVDSAINRNTESLLNKSGSVTRYSASSIASTVSRLSGLVWDDELEYLSVRDPQQAAEGGASMGQEWRSDTTRMVLWYLFGYSVVVIMFVIALILYGRPVAGTRGLLPWTYIHSWTIYQASMIIVSATMVSIYFLPLLFIRHDFDAGRRFVNDPSFLQKIGVVIPCHKSEKEIGEVVKRVIKYIPPGNIIVCDNGNFDGPADNTFQVVKSIHPSIQYCFIKQGHKTRALWTGAHRLPRHVDYIMHLDDDTHLSDSMVFDESHFTSAYNKDHVIAVAFLRSSERINRVTNFTDFWYKITDHFHGTQAYITTRCFVPGPAGLWKRSKFIEVFGAHPALPFGEDIFGGFTTLNKGYAIRSEMRCMVKTFAPPILVNYGTGGRVQGYGAASIWKQRAHRWTVSALRITGKSLYSFFTYNSRGGVLSNIAFRLYRFREYKIIVVQLFYIPFLIVIFARGFYFEFVVLKMMLFALPLLRNIYINYVCWHGKPELQVDFETVLLSPFFNFFLIMCAVHGRLKCILWYIPNVPLNHGMLQRCRPQPFSHVDCTEVETNEEGETVNFCSSWHKDGALTAFINNPLQFVSTITTKTSPLAVQRKGFDGVSSTSQGEDSNKKDLQNFKTIAEQLLQTRDDVYELFERDGSSSVVEFCSNGDGEEHDAGSVQKALISAAYQPPTLMGDENRSTNN